MFNNMHRCMGKPILLALVAGSAAYTHEQLDDKEIIDRAMEKLRKVITKQILSWPLYAVL